MINMFNAEYFKDKLCPSFLPARAVQRDDTWNISRERLMHGGNPNIVDAVKPTAFCLAKIGLTELTLLTLLTNLQI